MVDFMEYEPLSLAFFQRIEAIEFGGGVTWDWLQLLQHYVTIARTDGNDFVYGFEVVGDTLDGGAGTAQLDANGDIVFTPHADFTGATQFRYTVSDGRNGFAEATVDVRVRPVASARDDSGYSVAEDEFLVIRAERLLSNDADGDRMVVGEVFGAVNGSVSLSSTGDITFTPSADFNGVAQFRYAANTPEGGRAEATVTLNVTPVNDAPRVANNSGFSTLEDVPFQIAVSALLANDSDADGDPLTVSAVHSNANVDVSLTSDGYVVVTPRTHFWGAAFFEYTVSDPSGLTGTGRVNFEVTPVNNAPEAQDDLIVTDGGLPLLEDFPIVIDFAELLGNDTDADVDPLTITAVRNAFGGRVELLDNNTILFTPTANFNGDARFTYVVSDGQGGQSEALAVLRYQPVNDIPVANDDSYESPSNLFLRGEEDRAIEIPIAELLQNDFDVEGLSIAFGSFGNAVHGDVVMTDHGTLIFTPDADFWGEATFSYLITDPEGAVDDALVTMWFENVDDAPPVARDDVIEVYEDIPTVIPLSVLLVNDYDIDRDPIHFLSWRMLPGSQETAAISAIELNGDITFTANGDLLFTPHANSFVSSGFGYRITDDNAPPDFTTSAGEAPTGGPSQWAFVDIVMIPSHDEPTAQNDSGFVTPFNIPLVLRVSDLLANDFDVDEDGDVDVEPSERFTFSGVGAVSAGTATVETAGGEQFIVVRLPAGFTGSLSLEYFITDSTGLTDSGYVSATAAENYSGLLTGTPDPDWLEGNDIAETIFGRDDDDTILAHGGGDTIAGNGGDDDIRAGAGDDTIDGGEGGDRIDGGDGIDTVGFQGSNIWVRADLNSRVGQGGTAQGDLYFSIEDLVGSGFGDFLNGSEEANRLEGRDGGDTLIGRGGIDTLLGGAGDDLLEGGAGGDALDGGESTDTADYFLSPEAVQLSLADGTAFGGDAAGDQLTSIENLTGSDFDDTLIVDDGGNVLYGRRGNDQLAGGIGDDTLIGGQGADTLLGGDGTDIADYTLSATGVTVDLADALAGGGDAHGDTFSSIEIVQGSHQADQLLGDGLDNRFRGGDGADLIDGRGGFDTADYSLSDGPVTINLATGGGSGADAAGDSLVSIEHVIGSGFADHLIGSTADDRFTGGYGDDLLEGGFGSDTYNFGFDGSEDTISEQGSALDVDRLVLASGVRPRDVSLVRQGDNLLVELERDSGILVDTTLVTGHFLGRQTGIEEIVFADGTVWDRQRIDDIARTGRFNAENDLVRFADEDVVTVIDPQVLFANDASEGVEQLQLVSVGNAANGSVSIAADGTIQFLGAPDYNGDAFFDYTVRDEFGRESTARVEVNLAPVNDAPVGVDDEGIDAIEDVVLMIPFSALLGNDIDVDGDELTIVAIAPLFDDQGNPLYAGISPKDVTNGTADIRNGYIEFTPDEDFFGFAGFTYTLSDPSGFTSTATVEIHVAPVNDAPRSRDDDRTIRLETTTSILVADLLRNDYDVEGDDFTFVGVHSPTNGTMAFDQVTGMANFTPDALGDASFSYDLVDARGAASTIVVELTVIPLNDPPDARNDSGFTTLEDQPIVIDVADLLVNDIDGNGDVLTITSVGRFPLNGKVTLNGDGTITFVPRADYNGNAGFKYTVSDGRGGFDTAFVAIDVVPDNDGPQLRDDVVQGLEDAPIVIIPGLVFGNDMDPDGDVIFFDSASLIGAIDQSYTNRGVFSEVLGANETLVLDAGDGVFVASLANGRALPYWLDFDAETKALGFTEITPDESAEPVRVVVRFVPDAAELPDGSFATGVDGFAVEFLIDPLLPIDPAINTLLANAGALAGAGQFGVDLSVATNVSAMLEDGGPLPSWLAFDASSLTFTGTPPAE